jgi:hypothetical protein
MWGSLCVCCVSFEGDGGAEGKCGWELGRCILWRIDRIEMETSEKTPTWKAAWVV